MAAQVASVAAPDAGGQGPALVLAGGICYLRFFVSGKPEPKGRPRFARRGDHVQTFTPDTTLNWEQNVGWQVKQQLLQLTMSDDSDEELRLPFEGRVVMELRFNMDKPKSTPKKVEFPVKARSDVDNLAKAVMDALQNCNVIKNDNIVTDLSCSKRFSCEGHPQGVEIEMTAWL